jgi:hypothetical protein
VALSKQGIPELSSQRKVFQMSIYLCILEPMMGAVWPVPEMQLKASFLLFQCKVLGFFLMVLISSAAIPAWAPTLNMLLF